MRALALFFSGVFHPLFLPTYMVGLAFWMKPFESYYYNASVQIYIVLQVFVISTVLPMGALLLLIWWNKVSDIMVGTRQERSLPYLINAFCLAALYFNFKNIGLADFITGSVLGALVSVLIAYVINRKWKISAHGIGMGGALGMLLALTSQFTQPVLMPLAILILLLGLVGSSRLFLQAHTPAQVYTGYAVGVLSLYICLSI